MENYLSDSAPFEPVDYSAQNNPSAYVAAEPTMGNNPSAYVAPGYSPTDIAEALGYTGLSPELATTTAGALSWDTGHEPGEGPNYSSSAATPTSNDTLTKQLSDIINGVGGSIEKNKELYKTVLSGVGGAFAAQRQKEAAAALAQSRLDELSKADDIKRAEQARNAAAITGLSQGIIGKQMALKRTNGSQVFNPNGTVNKG